MFVFDTNKKHRILRYVVLYQKYYWGDFSLNGSLMSGQSCVTVKVCTEMVFSVTEIK